MGAVLLVLVIGAAASAADNFKSFKLNSPDGERKTLEDFLDKATLVTFFFPTCGFCNAEFPYLQEMQDRYKGRGLSMVAINIVAEQNSQVADWKLKHRYTIPLLLCSSQDALMNDYDLERTPTHFLLDSTGKVLFKQEGYSPGDEKKLEARIQNALGVVP
jgi:peroxiredoxin